jgi:acrylyl-CoA reductase (NADPH)
MGIGTAGFTAMLSVMALEDTGAAPGGREALVTGASGGVGSVAVAVLAHRGYEVVAATGRVESHEYLRSLGAKQIIGREELAPPGGPLASERWAAAVDTVGGETLANVLRSVARGGGVAACGNVGGAALNTTVLPFILRGVRLLGIDSVMCPVDRRRAAWRRLAAELPHDALERMLTVIPLRDVPQAAEAILQGQVRGRTVVDVNA